MDRKSQLDGLAAVPEPSRTTFLNGWKEIAMYVGRGVRTVQRWEALGLPVRRPKSRLRSAVVTTTEEVDTWLESCGNGRMEEMPRLANGSVEDYARLAAEVTLLRARVEQLRAENDMLRQQLAHFELPPDRAATASRDAA